MSLHCFSGGIQTTPPPSKQRCFFLISTQISPLPPISRTKQYLSLPFSGPLIFSEKGTFRMKHALKGFLAVIEQTLTSAE